MEGGAKRETRRSLEGKRSPRRRRRRRPRRRMMSADLWLLASQTQLSSCLQIGQEVASLARLHERTRPPGNVAALD